MSTRIEVLCDGFRSALDADLDTMTDDEVGQRVKALAKACAKGRCECDARPKFWDHWPGPYKRG